MLNFDTIWLHMNFTSLISTTNLMCTLGQSYYFEVINGCMKRTLPTELRVSTRRATCNEDDPPPGPAAMFVICTRVGVVEKVPGGYPAAMSDMTVRYLTGMSYTSVRYLTVMSHATAI